MTKKLFTFLFILLAIVSLSVACTGADEDYEDDSSYGEEYDDEEDAEDYDEEGDDGEEEGDDESSAGPSPACLIDLEAMLNDENGDYGAGSDDMPEFDEEYILVTYQVDGDRISDPRYEEGIPDELGDAQTDAAAQEAIWLFFTDLVPADQRALVGEFVVFSDGYDNIIGAVDEADAAGLWTLEMDILDAQDFPTLATTLVHEFAHMLTLDASQVNDRATCANYMTIDGCSESDSYLNAFYEQFWTDIYGEWEDTVMIGGEVDEDKALAFYEDYADQFVSDYAPTGPEEDIAEAFIYFIFGPKPAGDTIAEEKILFFYAYPELVELRQDMLATLCEYGSH